MYLSVQKLVDPWGRECDDTQGSPAPLHPRKGFVNSKVFSCPKKKKVGLKTFFFPLILRLRVGDYKTGKMASQHQHQNQHQQQIMQMMQQHQMQQWSAPQQQQQWAGMGMHQGMGIMGNPYHHGGMPNLGMGMGALGNIGMGSGGGGGRAGRNNAPVDPAKEGPPGCNLFVYHCPPSWSNNDITSTFAAYGNIVSATIMKNKVLYLCVYAYLYIRAHTVINTHVRNVFKSNIC